MRPARRSAPARVPAVAEAGVSDIVKFLSSDAPLHQKVHHMTFWEHVEELRQAVIHSLIAVALTSLGAWFVSGRVLERIVTDTTVAAVFLTPTEALSARVRVTLTLGVIAALPVVAFRLWRFVMPGLLRRERDLLAPLVLLSTVFFYAGAAFGYFLLVPGMMRVLLAFGTVHIQPMLGVGNTLSFVLGMSLACGGVFQLPLVIAVLAHLGLVTPAMLLSRWREAVLGIFVFAAIITPGDAASSTLMLGLPVSALYFLSILLAAVVSRRKTQQEDADAVGG